MEEQNRNNSLNITLSMTFINLEVSGETMSSICDFYFQLHIVLSIPLGIASP